jgi:hypothetical protein
LNDIQLRHQQQMDGESEKYAVERRDLAEKAERQSAELTRKDRQLTTMENQVEAMNAQMGQKSNLMEQIKAETL